MQIGRISNHPNMWCFLQFLMKWRCSLFVADVSSSHNGSGKRWVFFLEARASESWKKEQRQWAAAAEPAVKSQRGCSSLDGKGCVGSGERCACLLLKTLNQQLLTFSLLSRDGWKILIFKLQVTNLEWSAWPPAAAPIWDLFEVWPPPTPEGNMCRGCSEL